MGQHHEKETRRPTVLLVEDDAAVRTPLAEYLRTNSYVVREAAGVGEAIALFSAGEAIDLVVSDIQMPRPGDGLLLARWIRRQHPGVRIVLASGYGYPGHAAGLAEVFLAKPYHVADVAACIGPLLSNLPPPRKPD